MQTQEQILEIAQRYGVPTPDTCKVLNWQSETLFYWGQKNNSKEFILLVKNKINFNGLIGVEVFFIAPQIKHANKYKNYEFDLLIPAPQMHEIAILIPLCLPHGFKLLQLKNSAYSYDAYVSSYLSYMFDSSGNTDFSIGKIAIQNHHYAEAYAQMYIKLKELEIF